MSDVPKRLLRNSPARRGYDDFCFGLTDQMVASSAPIEAADGVVTVTDQCQLQPVIQSSELHDTGNYADQVDDERLFFRGLFYGIVVGTLLWGLLVMVLVA